jgi:hypothetical protein
VAARLWPPAVRRQPGGGSAAAKQRLGGCSAAAWRRLGNLGGVEAENIPCQGRPYSIEVRLPGLSMVIFRQSSAKLKG